MGGSRLAVGADNRCRPWNKSQLAPTSPESPDLTCTELVPHVQHAVATQSQ